MLTILNLSVEWPSLERISSSSCTFVTIVQFCVQYTVPNFLRNFGNGKFKEQPGLTQKIQWSRVRIRHLSRCMDKTLRTGRVTVSNVKSQGREGNLAPPEANRKNIFLIGKRKSAYFIIRIRIPYPGPGGKET